MKKIIVLVVLSFLSVSINLIGCGQEKNNNVDITKNVNTFIENRDFGLSNKQNSQRVNYEVLEKTNYQEEKIYNNNISLYQTFSGKILSIDNKYVIFEPSEQYEETMGDKVMFFYNDNFPNLKIGDYIEGLYDGVILTSYPAQITPIEIK